MRSESAFLLMKLAYSGGEPCIKKFLEHDVIPELVKMMQYHIAELQSLLMIQIELTNWKR